MKKGGCPPRRPCALSLEGSRLRPTPLPLPPLVATRALAGRVTRTLFLKAHVNPQDFATFPVLRRMIAGVEQVYKLITDMHSPGATLRLATDEALRLRELTEVRAAASQRSATDNSEEDEDSSPHAGGGGAAGGGGGEGGAEAAAGAGAAAVGSGGGVGAAPGLALPLDVVAAAAAAAAPAPAAPAPAPSPADSSRGSSSSSKRARTS